MQGEMESVESYVQDVINLCHKVGGGMSERVQIKHVLRGLKPSLLEKVMLMENDTLEHLLANIRKVETARFMAGQRVDHLMGEPTRVTELAQTSATRSATKLESQLESLTNEFTKLSMRLLEQQAATRGVSSRDNNGETRRDFGGGNSNGSRGNYRGRGRGDRREHRRGRTEDGRVICYKCNRPGHYAVACHSQDQGNGSGSR